MDKKLSSRSIIFQMFCGNDNGIWEFETHFNGIDLVYFSLTFRDIENKIVYSSRAKFLHLWYQIIIWSCNYLVITAQDYDLPMDVVQD